MPETWEILTLRGLAPTDERAETFVGALVELHENLGRLLARSTGITRRTS